MSKDTFFSREELYELVSDMTVQVSFGKRMAGDVVFTKHRVADLPLNAFAHVLEYGVRQKVQDAGASDKTPTDKRDSGIAVWERLCKGEIGRVSADGVTDLQYEARLIAANKLRELKPEEWKELKGAEKKVLNARLDGIVAKFPAISIDAQAELDRKAAHRERMANLKIDIDL